MKNKRFLATSFLIVLLSATRAWAGHVVWLDFSGFHLKAWTLGVNGNKPPEDTDLEAIQKQVIANVSEDYATFDIILTTTKPANGRYTRVKVLGTDGEGVGGCSGSDCCLEGDCTGIGSWDDDGVTESALEVYSGNLSNKPEFTGSNATTARIARGISGSVSHELGHILGLEHCNAADDSIKLGCENTTLMTTEDKNVRWHIMASKQSWGLSDEEQATRDRFFSVHSERRILAGAVQLRNHFAPLPNVNGGDLADLLYGRLSSPSTMKWFARKSNGFEFGEFSKWAGDAGDAGDIFLTGDVNQDGRSDLVFGRIQSQTQVTWYVQTSNGSGFDPFSEWSADGGDAGDIFRLADVDDDQRADLVIGRAVDLETVRWFVRKSDGSSFGSPSTWANDAGDVGDLFFVADVDDDGDADLVYSRAIPPAQVKWFVRKSDGSSFGSLETWHDDAGDGGDLMYIGDANGDGSADLVYGHVKSKFDVIWSFHASTGSSFGNAETWVNAGDSGDLFRLGDTTGDGQLDLMYGRPLGMTSPTATPNLGLVRWYGRSSQGTSFSSSVSTWASDAGDEGDCFP